jgi:hypothetical protein
LFVALVVGAGCASQDAAPDIAYRLSLEPGQSTVEVISTHCGYERLEVLINGKFWMTDGLAADEAGNPTEPDWPQGQKAELELELLDRDMLRVKAVDSDVAHVYQPVETEPWCE